MFLAKPGIHTLSSQVWFLWGTDVPVMFSTFRAKACDKPKSMYTTCGPCRNDDACLAKCVRTPLFPKDQESSATSLAVMPMRSRNMLFRNPSPRCFCNRDCAWPSGLAPALVNLVACTTFFKTNDCLTTVPNCHGWWYATHHYSYTVYHTHTHTTDIHYV